MKFGLAQTARYATLRLLGLLMVTTANVTDARDLPTILSAEGNDPTTYLPDFSYAGYGFGIEAIPIVEKVINVAEYGAIPDDSKDDSATLKAALAAAHQASGPVRV